jgi:hypothetical protein
MNNENDCFTSTQRKQMIAYEAFLRRASTSKLPFMLKGSMLSRQHFPIGIQRFANDLDWVCLEPFTDIDVARELLNSWMSAITDQEKDDGVRFRSFMEAPYWQMIDYAMDEDFPTVNTEVMCWVGGEQLELCVDVSFNLEVSEPPVNMKYYPLIGEPFTLDKTTPLSLQIAWKLHQCIVRPRLKDIFDLTNLLKHPTFDKAMFHQVLQALLKECVHGDVTYPRLLALFADDTFREHPELCSEWSVWHVHQNVTAPNLIAPTYSGFIHRFKKAMQKAGFYELTINDLPLESMNVSNASLNQINTSLVKSEVMKCQHTSGIDNQKLYENAFAESKPLPIQYVGFWQWFKTVFKRS